MPLRLLAVLIVVALFSPAEAQKGNLEINPVGGEALAKSVQGVLQLESGSVARLKEILR